MRSGEKRFSAKGRHSHEEGASVSIRRLRVSKHSRPLPVSAAFFSIAGLAAATALSACGSSSSDSAATSSGSKPATTTNMTFALDYTIDGLHAPMYVAKSKGYYSAAGLNVTLQPGQGSSDAIHKVETGVAQMGLASATNVLIAM